MALFSLVPCDDFNMVCISAAIGCSTEPWNSLPMHDSAAECPSFYQQDWFYPLFVALNSSIMNTEVLVSMWAFRAIFLAGRILPDQEQLLLRLQLWV